MTHGTETCYVHHRCRCAACREASTLARRGRVKIERRVGRERGLATRFKTDLVHEETLDRLRTVPEYRELIRQRVSEVQKQRRDRDLRILGSYW